MRESGDGARQNGTPRKPWLGLAMLSGVLIRLGAISIIIVMLGAIFLVHLEHGFDIGKGGMEYALTQLLVATALLITAAGRYSPAGVLPAWLRKL